MVLPGVLRWWVVGLAAVVVTAVALRVPFVEGVVVL